MGDWTKAFRKRVGVRLKAAIEKGEFVQGSRLVEQNICKLFDVSRATLRTVIHRLASEGLVDIEPRRGAYVVKLTPEDVAEALEVREVLEGLAASKTALLCRREDIGELHRLSGLMERAVEAADFYNYNDLNRQFHEILVKNCGNSKVIAAVDTIRAQLVLLQVRGLLMPGRARQSLQEHGRVLAAVEGRDPGAAEAAAREHVRNLRQATLSALQRGIML